MIVICDSRDGGGRTRGPSLHSNSKQSNYMPGCGVSKSRVEGVKRRNLELFFRAAWDSKKNPKHLHSDILAGCPALKPGGKKSCKCPLFLILFFLLTHLLRLQFSFCAAGLSNESTLLRNARLFRELCNER